MVRRVEKTPDCVEAVRPGFKAESIPPDGAVAAEALAATSIDRLEAYHGQEVIVAELRLALQHFQTDGEESMVLVDIEDGVGFSRSCGGTRHCDGIGRCCQVGSRP
jgi:hypothetical protein